MQPLARDGLTDAQVLTILRDAPSLVAQRGLELLDQGLNFVEDISDDFLTGTVTRTAQATIHGTCDLVLARDVDYGTQLLRPYMLLTGAGLTARFNGGVYVPRKPETDYGDSVLSNAISGSDRLLQLNRPIGDAWVAPAGQTYRDEVLRLFTAAGIPPGQVLFDGTKATASIPADVPFPLLVDSSSTSVMPVDAVADDSQATTFLRAVNTLLGAISYRGVWCDWNGLFRCDPYTDAGVRPADLKLDYDDPLRTIIAPARSLSRDVSTTANRWIGQRTNLEDGDGNPLEPVEGAGQFTLSNLDQGDTSINARGGDPLGVYATVLQLDADSQDTLVALVRKQAAQDMAVATKFAISTSPLPAAWHEDVYSLSDVEVFGGAVTVISNGWVLDYGSSGQPVALMTHQLQLVS